MFLGKITRRQLNLPNSRRSGRVGKIKLEDRLEFEMTPHGWSKHKQNAKATAQWGMEQNPTGCSRSSDAWVPVNKRELGLPRVETPVDMLKSLWPRPFWPFGCTRQHTVFNGPSRVLSQHRINIVLISCIWNL
jgi:hypothetical protein